MDYKRMSRWIVLAMAMVALMVGVVAVSAAADSVSILKNGDFEAGKKNWAPLKATLVTGAPAQAGKAAAKVTNSTNTVRGELFQTGLTLQPQTEYELSFWARSDGGHDLAVNLTRLGTATNYGLSESFDVSTDWQQFSATFTTTGLNKIARDGRLRFQLPVGKGASVNIDGVTLIKVEAPPPPPPDDFGFLVFDWNQPVTQAMSGFAQYKPLSDYPQFPNGNWVNPVDYTTGTLWFRAKVFGIPKDQPNMKLGFCFWQIDPKYGEECSSNFAVFGAAGTDETWSEKMKKLKPIHQAPIDWSQPRWKAGFVVRNSRGPVTKKLGLDWSGEQPKNWYPLNIRYTVIMTDGPEPDWTKYGWPNN